MTDREREQVQVNRAACPRLIRCFVHAEARFRLYILHAYWF
jgi:hypothetical protein